MELKNNDRLLAELEKDAVDKSFPLTNSIILSPESTPNNQERGNTNYWLKNYPKIQQLFCSEMTSNNEQISRKKYIFENGTIKKLLEVSPQQSLPSKYFKLREFLAVKKWSKANYETYFVMLQVAGQEKEGFLDVEDIEKFPWEYLRIIDQLWVKYSDGKFGFSVQKKIYLEEDGRKEYSEKEVWENFCIRIGWLVEKARKSSEERVVKRVDINYGKGSRGHLPWPEVTGTARYWVSPHPCVRFLTLLSRRDL